MKGSAGSSEALSERAQYMCFGALFALHIFLISFSYTPILNTMFVFVVVGTVLRLSDTYIKRVKTSYIALWQDAGTNYLESVCSSGAFNARCLQLTLQFK